MGEYGWESHQAMILVNYSMTFPSAATSPLVIPGIIPFPKEAGVILGGVQDEVAGVIVRKGVCSGSTLISCMT